MLTSLIKSYYKVIILSLCLPNLVQKIWSTPNLCNENEIQNGVRRHLEFTSGGYFWHTAIFTLSLSTIIQTRNKSNDYFESLHGTTRVTLPIITTEKTFLPIHVAEKIRKSSVWNLILCSGAIWHLNMGAQPHIVPYKKRWKHFWKLHGLIDFWCAQTLALLCTFGTTTTNWLFFVAPCNIFVWVHIYNTWCKRLS